MMMKRSNVLIGVILAALPLASAHAKGTDVQCVIPGHGAISLNAPAGWAVTCGATTEEPASANVRILPAKGGDEFKLLLTPIWIPANQRNNVEPAKIKAAVQSMAESVLPGAVETTVNLVELASGSARGYFFSVTDKSPKPGEFKYMMQGSVATGELLVAVTFLYRDAATSDKAAVMALLKAARHTKTP